MQASVSVFALCIDISADFDQLAYRLYVLIHHCQVQRCVPMLVMEVEFTSNVL